MYLKDYYFILLVILIMCLLLFIFWYLFIFFFKQKTAYEMRISDWSSDVCSSDLITTGDFATHRFAATLAKKIDLEPALRALRRAWSVATAADLQQALACRLELGSRRDGSHTARHLQHRAELLELQEMQIGRAHV